MKTLYLFLSVIFAFHYSSAQWSAIGSGINTSTDAVAIYNNQLIAGGKTTTLGKWSGSAWSSFTPSGSPAVTALLSEGSDLYAGGLFAGGDANKVISHYDGSNWSVLGGSVSAYSNVTWNPNSKWSRIFSYNNNVYGLYDAGIVKYNSGSQSFAAPGNVVNDLGAIVNGIRYGGVASNVAYFSGFNNGRQRVITWNDSEWDTLNLSAYPNRSISSIAVVNNEVFMSGMFQKANSSSFSLLKWNGTTITEVFAFGISVPTVVKMFVVSHHLFAEYTIQGFRHFGYWNGSGFTGLGDVVLGTSGSIDAVTEMSNIVYVGGTFSTFDGVTVNNIAQHGVVVGIENILEESPLGFYPNPATGYIVLDASDELRTIAVYNALGQLCHQYLLNAGECFLSLEDLQPGAYIVRAVSREKIQTGRVIIE